MILHDSPLNFVASPSSSPSNSPAPPRDGELVRGEAPFWPTKACLAYAAMSSMMASILRSAAIVTRAPWIGALCGRCHLDANRLEPMKAQRLGRVELNRALRTATPAKRGCR